MAHPIVRSWVQILTAAVLIAIALVAYLAYAEWNAERKAREFCSVVKTGEDVSSLLERALASGADERHTRWAKSSTGEAWLPVTFTGFTPISRHICSIEGSDKISSAKYVYLD